MVLWLKLLLLVLATWRVTGILVYEKVAYPFRRLFGAKYDTLMRAEVFPDTTLAYLIQCFKCTSVWVAGLLYLVYLYDVRWLIPLAISAAAIWVDEKIS